MKKRSFLASLAILFAVQITVLLVFSFQKIDTAQDTVSVNEAVHSVQNDWDIIGRHKNLTDLDYVVLDQEGRVCHRTKPGLSETLHAAVLHRDTILDLESNGRTVGKIIIYNNSHIYYQNHQQKVILFLSAALTVQAVICILYFTYFSYTILGPFEKLKGFAERIALGNLDIPLEMDKRNLFGAFTEAFDIMRTELKKARAAEAKANESKKELVANLSHDIKTPIASIKAVSEVGIQLTDNENIQNKYKQIIQKTDEINTLITNLFTAALEELSHLNVTPEAVESHELKALLENSDYLSRARISNIPDCLIYADRLRLQQVFDNIFANSYKYADTSIDVTISADSSCSDVPRDYACAQYIAICIEDYGGGAADEELPLLKEKFRRGSNIKNIEGAGLGLYISDYFMKEMHGRLMIENGQNGLRVTVILAVV